MGLSFACMTGGEVSSLIIPSALMNKVDAASFSATFEPGV